MDLLVATAALGSYGYSAVAVLLGHSHLYFDVTVAIVLVVTAGTHYEKSVKRRATGLLAELTERQVDEARLESGETVPLSRPSSPATGSSSDPASGFPSTARSERDPPPSTSR